MDMSQGLGGHLRLIVHLVVFLALLGAWVYTREGWLIGMIAGIAVTLGVERAPQARDKLSSSP